MKRKFDYSLLLLEYLKRKKGEFIDIKRISAELKLPPAYMEKVAQGLKKDGWLEARKGAGGGYSLAKDPQAVSVESLINFYAIYPFCPVLRELKK